MRRIALVAALLALGACGVDGPPEPVPGGMTLSGEARIGVVSGL